MTIDITQIIVAIIGVLGTVFAGMITTYLIPWLKSKLTVNQLDVVSGLIYNGVKAAETLYTASGSGQKKFQYVMDSVKAFCESNHMAFDEVSVKNEIQSVWDDLYNKANPAAEQASVQDCDASKGNTSDESTPEKTTVDPVKPVETGAEETTRCSTEYPHENATIAAQNANAALEQACDADTPETTSSV